MDPEQTAPMSRLIWVHTVCHRGFLNISADEKSRQLLLPFVHKGLKTILHSGWPKQWSFLATLSAVGLKMYNKGITVFKTFIWGGILSDKCIGLEIYIIGTHEQSDFQPYYDDIPPQMNILNMVIPILIHFYACLLLKSLFRLKLEHCKRQKSACHPTI